MTDDESSIFGDYPDNFQKVELCPLCGKTVVMVYEDGVLVSDECLGGCYQLEKETRG